jgi:Flp pilus assembly protein TadD
VLEKVRRLLESTRVAEALQLLASCNAKDWRVQNARGVCLMRLGRIEEAIRIFRDLTLEAGSIIMKSNLDPQVQLNFATALLLDQNVEGCERVLAEIEANSESGLSVTEPLRSALRDRECNLTWKQKLLVWITRRHPMVRLNFPPGEIV